MNLYTEEVLKRFADDFRNYSYRADLKQIESPLDVTDFLEKFKEVFKSFSSWSDISTAPKDGSEILVSDGFGTKWLVSWYENNWVDDKYNTVDNVTYYMLIPELPKPTKN